MQRQRTLFFGKIPKKFQKKDGKNLPVSKKRFRAISSRDTDVHFTNTTVTQFGGYLLWDSFLKRFVLDAKLAQHIKMNRGSNGFTVPEVSRFFIDSRILGGERK